jgi:hypothetical protein
MHQFSGWQQVVKRQILFVPLDLGTDGFAYDRHVFLDASGA